jgi:hypothetical protein
MSFMFTQDTDLTAKALQIAVSERSKALSAREWKHRLAGYGYGLRETDEGMVLETLPHHVQICMLPADLSA